MDKIAARIPEIGRRLAAVDHPLGWTTGHALEQTAFRVASSFEADIRELEAVADKVFSEKAYDCESSTQETIDILRRWQTGARAPSIAALAVLGARRLGVTLSPERLTALLTGGIIAEIDCDHPYHNNMHFRKVLLQIIRLCLFHNRIFGGTARAFDDERIFLLLLVGSVHDVGHDGMGNVVRGVFQAGRLEERSFAIARPYLEAAGFSDVQALETMQVMILCTDVTPPGDPASLTGQMKAAFRHHFLAQGRKARLNLDEPLAALQGDAMLTAMSAILHEADIGTSAGVDYAVTQYETMIYRIEIGEPDARPQHILDFLNDICQRRMLSEAAQQLYGANMARIQALAEDDMRRGNVPFAHRENPVLLLSDDPAAGESKSVS